MKNLLLGLIVLSSSAILYFSGEILKVNKLSTVTSNSSVSVISTPAPEDLRTRLMLLGDVMLGRSVNMRSLEMGNVNYPFEKVAGKLREADIVFANLENPIIKDCPIIEHGYTFCADPKMADGLVYSGIDVVSLANNHTLNFGREGYQETKKILDSKGILWVGDGNLAVIEKKGVKYGFLGFDKSQQTYPIMDKNEINLIKNSDTKVDVLVVGMHWGVEYQNKALPGVTKLANILIENGADVIAGNHPHWVQNDEKISGKPVYYALGNFVFDQMWSEETRKGLAVELIFEGNNIVGEEKHPSYIREWAQPEWVE